MSIDSYISEFGEHMRSLMQRFVQKSPGETSSQATSGVRVVSHTLSKAPAGAIEAGWLGQPEFATEILDAFGADLLHLGRVAQAEPYILVAFDSRASAFGEDHPITAKSYNTLACLQRMQGDFAKAEKTVRRALAINSRVYGEDSYAASGNLTELAIIQMQAGEFESAKRAAVRGLQILERLYLEESDPNTTRLLDVLGRVLQMKGLYSEAVEIYQRILQHDAKQAGKECSLKYAAHLANYALVLLSQRNHVAAEPLYRRAIEIYSKNAHVPSHPDLIDIRSGLASLLAEQKRPEAIGEYRELIELGRKLRGSDHLYVGNDHAGLARAIYLAEQGDYLEDAKVEFDRALAIYFDAVKAGHIAADHAFIAEAKGWKARIIAEQGGSRGPDREQFGKEAEDLATAALKKFQAEFAEDSVEIAITRAIIGRALTLQERDLDRALALLTAAQPIVVAARGANSRIAQLIAAWIEQLSGKSSAPSQGKQRSP